MEQDAETRPNGTGEGGIRRFGRGREETRKRGRVWRYGHPRENREEKERVARLSAGTDRVVMKYLGIF